MVSDIPAGDGKLANFFYSVRGIFQLFFSRSKKWQTTFLLVPYLMGFPVHGGGGGETFSLRYVLYICTAVDTIFNRIRPHNPLDQLM